MERLYPLQELSPHDYCVAFGDILSGINELAKKGMPHRDITPGNLMYRRLADGNVHGILNDSYDPTMIVEGNELDYSPRVQKRTETLAFMAMDVLDLGSGKKIPKRILRFHLESMLYIFIWDAATDGKEIIPWPLTAWLQSNFDKACLTSQLVRECMPLCRMEPVRHQLAKLALQLQLGRSDELNALFEPSPQEFDNETLGGHFTYEKFAAILEEMKGILRGLG